MKRLLIILSAILVLAGVVVAVGLHALFGERVSFQTGLASCEGIPVTATDISVFRNENMSGMFVADFRISEADFLAFAAEKGWSVVKVAPPGTSGPIFTAQALHVGRGMADKQIFDGYYYSKRAPNGGGVTVAWDRAEGRGYLDISAR